MNRFNTYLRWLVCASLVDWLITRTLTRLAIFMPKSPTVIAIYKSVTVVGQVASSLTGLLALGVLIWIAWVEWQARDRLWLPLGLLTSAGLSLVFLFSMPPTWAEVGWHLIALGLIAFLAWRITRRKYHVLKTFALLIPAFVLVFGGLYKLGPVIFEALGWSGPPPFTGLLFNLGEMLVVLVPISLWMAHRQSTPWMVWVGGAVPAIAFVVIYLVDPAITGILSIWSVGLSLYLPWPIYAVSLWFMGTVLIIGIQDGHPWSWGLLLLIAGGYAPQLSTQAFLGLIALWMLGQSADSVSPSMSLTVQMESALNEPNI